MLEFLLADANLPFTLALGLMLGIALLEGLGLLAGFERLKVPWTTCCLAPSSTSRRASPICRAVWRLSHGSTSVSCRC